MTGYVALEYPTKILKIILTKFNFLHHFNQNNKQHELWYNNNACEACFYS